MAWFNSLKLSQLQNKFGKTKTLSYLCSVNNDKIKISYTMALPTLTDFLNSWDKLTVTGMTPERSDSVMTLAPNGVKVTIEYRHQINSSTGECSTVAFLVAYDEYGNRVTLRNQTYGCFDDEEKQFHQWFAKKMASAMELDARRRRDLSDGIDMVLAS